MNSEKPKNEDTSKQSDAGDQKDLEESAYENTVPILTLEDDAVILVEEGTGIDPYDTD
jgi:hypothetical protein